MTANTQTSFSVWYDGRLGTFKNIGAYFPDFSMKLSQNSLNISGNNDSGIVWVSVPAVKLYTRSAKFSATVSPTPASGNISFRYLNKTSNNNKDSLSAYPDSIRLVIKANGAVTAGAYTVTVQGNGPNGTPVHRRIIALNVGPTGINNVSGIIPKEYSLKQNYPNRFNPVTTINFNIPKNEFVRLNVYDLSGKLVKVLVNKNLNSGKYSITLDGTELSSGVYFYKLQTSGYTATKSLMLIK